MVLCVCRAFCPDSNKGILSNGTLKYKKEILKQMLHLWRKHYSKTLFGHTLLKYALKCIFSLGMRCLYTKRKKPHTHMKSSCLFLEQLSPQGRHWQQSKPPPAVTECLRPAPVLLPDSTACQVADDGSSTWVPHWYGRQLGVPVSWPSVAAVALGGKNGRQKILCHSLFQVA